MRQMKYEESFTSLIRLDLILQEHIREFQETLLADLTNAVCYNFQ